MRSSLGYYMLASLLAFAIPNISYGQIISGQFGFNNAMPTDTISFMDADCSFDIDISLTSNTPTGNIAFDSEAVGFQSGANDDEDFDTVGESVSVQIAISNFVNLSGNNITLSGLSVTEVQFEAAASADDSGTFVLPAGNFTWIDSNSAPTAGPWELENNRFDLRLANGGDLTSFTYDLSLIHI